MSSHQVRKGALGQSLLLHHCLSMDLRGPSFSSEWRHSRTSLGSRNHHPCSSSSSRPRQGDASPLRTQGPVPNPRGLRSPLISGASDFPSMCWCLRRSPRTPYCCALFARVRPSGHPDFLRHHRLGTPLSRLSFASSHPSSCLAWSPCRRRLRHRRDGLIGLGTSRPSQSGLVCSCV